MADRDVRLNYAKEKLRNYQRKKKNNVVQTQVGDNDLANDLFSSSNSEALFQLTEQFDGLLNTFNDTDLQEGDDDATVYWKNIISKLELRNLELASQLEAKLKDSNELSAKLIATENNLSSLQKSFEMMMTDRKEHDKIIVSSVDPDTNCNIAICSGILDRTETSINKMMSDPISNDQETMLDVKVDDNLQRFEDLYLREVSDHQKTIERNCNYEKELRTQIEALAHQVQSLQVERDDIILRQSELVKHVQCLENELQRQLRRQSQCCCENIRESLESQVATNVALNNEITCQSEKIKGLTENITRLKNSKQDALMCEGNCRELLQQYESDKVALSRSLLQNKNLKEQLEELQSALIITTNNKVELMNQLDELKHCLKNRSSTDDAHKHEIDGLHEAILERDRSLHQIRQELNQMRSEPSQKNLEQSPSTQPAVNLDEEKRDIPRLNTQVASLKLEHKFGELMSKLAEMSGQKEELEHIVARLQDETDTVGEYITIYRYQRSQHRKEMEARTLKLQLLAGERKELRQKINRLQGLVIQYLGFGPQNEFTGAPPVMETPRKQEGILPASVVSSEILALLSEIEDNKIMTEHFDPHFFWAPNVGPLIRV